MTAAVRRNDPEFLFFLRVTIHRATSKQPPPIRGLDGGAGVLRAKIVIFCIFGRRASPAAGAQRLLQARSACCRRAAPGASAVGASIADRAPQARGCSITRRGKLLYRASEDGSKRPERKRGSFALTRRGIYQCSITRRGARIRSD